MRERELDRALRQPRTWRPLAGPVDRVDVIETHLSRLYFAGEHVFKVKKPVDLGFADFSTLAKRRAACEDEVRLNARLAGETYLGIVAIARAGRGVRVGPVVQVGERTDTTRSPARSEPIEFAVAMKRLPAAQMLDAKLERGEIDAELLARLAARLAEFHAKARRGKEIDAFATPAALRRRVLGNLAESVAASRRLDGKSARPGRGRGAPTLPPALARLLRRAFRNFVERERPLLERRVRERRICEGHGDLHAGNVCVLPDRIVAFDCIEFSLAFRCVDVAGDLAFLLMDLDRLGFPAFARDLARRYAQRARDPELLRSIGFYSAYLACVRGKVAALRGIGTVDAAVRAAARLEAMRYFALAAGYALPPFLIVTSGLPASGKSHVARALARQLDAVHVQSDVERKRLAGLVPGEKTPPERLAEVYSGRMTFRTYVRMVELARRELSRGRNVILDATFPAARLRERPLALARKLRAPIVFVACAVGDAEARRRLAARAEAAGEYSEADLAVYERAKKSFEPPIEIPRIGRVEAGAESVAEELVLAVLERVVRQLERGHRSVSFRAG